MQTTPRTVANMGDHWTWLAQSAGNAEVGTLLQWLNREMDELPVPEGIEETVFWNLIARLERYGDPDRPVFWLLMTRVAEMALLCAGQYADRGEFMAAGDLIANPRSVLIYRKGKRQPEVKPRHTGMTEALGLADVSERVRCRTLLYETVTRVNQEALLPELLKNLRRSGRIPVEVVDGMQARVGRVADTIGFLSAWGVAGPEDLHRRTSAASDETRRFVAGHLCRFDDGRFIRLGREIRRLAADPDAACPWLSVCRPGEGEAQGR